MARPPRKPRLEKSAGDTDRFRKGSKWKRPFARGVKPARFARPRRKPSWRQAWRETRPWIFLIVFVMLGFVYQAPGRFEPPAFLQGAPMRVDETFTRCGPGRGQYCVTDGDTFKIGDHKYRVTGIDTAEVDARCPAEAVQAEASTAALQAWLNRGPFQITTRLDQPTDRYGRTLAIVKRVAADGSEDRLAEWMQTEGGARGYGGEGRGSWC